MSDNSVTVPLSDGAWSRSTIVTAEQSQPAAQPRVLAVAPIEQTKLEGRDFDQHRPGIMQTARCGKNGEMILDRPLTLDDVIDITLNSGKVMHSVPLRVAVREGFVAQSPDGRFVEADRAAQQATVNELQRVEAAQREAQAFRFADETHQAIHEMASAMSEAGLSFTNELAIHLGSNGEASVSEPAARWATSHGLDLKAELQKAMSHLRKSVIEECLQPRGVDPNAFLHWLETSGMHAARGRKAAMAAFVLRSLAGWHELADEYCSVGGRARQRRG